MVLAASCLAISIFTLQPASAQANSGLQAFLGTWKTTVNGKPAVSVQIFEYQGKLVGSVSNGDFDLDEKSNNAIKGWESHPGGAPIIEASVAGKTLSFKTMDTGGPLPWQLTLAAEGKAELSITESLPNGAKMPALEAVKEDSFPEKDKAPQDDSAKPLAEQGSTPPRVISSANPEYTSEARAKKISGTCLVGLTVDPGGMPANVHIVKSLDKGLDENAIQAVQKYRFTPATKDGVAVAKDIKIEANFQIN